MESKNSNKQTNKQIANRQKQTKNTSEPKKKEKNETSSRFVKEGFFLLIQTIPVTLRPPPQNDADYNPFFFLFYSLNDERFVVEILEETKSQKVD